ncbi:MAG: hypothetical protein ABEH83_14595, partial [Halobacterium sp.]
MTDGHTRRDWTDDPDTFASALDDLKADGALLLVLESAGSDASSAGCRRMLGEDAVGDRRRLFVLTDTDSRTHQGVRTVGGDTGQRAVAYRTAARNAVAASGGDARVPTTTVDSGPAALEDAVEAEVDALAPPDGFESGQLRVCVDALDEMITNDDLIDVLEFTKTLKETAHEHDGIAHVHVGNHVPAIAVEGLLPQFDAVVEVADDDDPRQRW